MQLKMAVRGRPIVLRRVATRFAVIAWFGYSSQQCSVVANEVTSMSTDLTFFTNEPGSTLLARFKKTLKDVQFFDILVGYFRSSGFASLQECFESIDKVRILVGLNLDSRAFEIVESYRTQTEVVTQSHKLTREIFADNVVAEMDAAPDDMNTETGVNKFLEYLQSGKIEIRAIPDRNVHAKVYISRFKPGDRDVGMVITGSSNFSLPGLDTNREFNVELKNSADVNFALNQFNQLWEKSVEVSQEYVATINNRTWMNDKVTPYQIYLKFLYEYFSEDINNDQLSGWAMPDGVLDLEYQKQAVVAAKKIIDQHGGVFIADVVGLGKTFISAMLAKRLGGRVLVICPPAIIPDWREAMLAFEISCRVESIGKLDSLVEDGTNQFKHVFIDEAHRFRNEMNIGYEQIHRICRNKNVVLVSATPLNNGIDDIYNQLKLFQVPKKSTIPGVPDIDKFFTSLRARLQIDRASPEYGPAAQSVHDDLREKLLKYVMVRRTRKEVVKYFSDDLNKQHVSFPEMAAPQRIVYEFDEGINSVFNSTMERLKKISYARYTPLLYLKTPLSDFEMQSQRNIGGFMKGVLVKRLESSFFAFKCTLDRFIDSYQKFIGMFEAGTVYIGKRIDIYDLLERDDDAELVDLVAKGKVSEYAADKFEEVFVEYLKADLGVLREIRSLWDHIDTDPKLDEFLDQLRSNSLLKKQKLIVFSESHETGLHLYSALRDAVPGGVMLFSSKGGNFEGEPCGKEAALEVIRRNFDPKKSSNRLDNIRVLITTDVLAEGVNLHNACVVINYDLPWNPTKVLQRVGRVNRIGTVHKKIHVFNFFPTAQSDMHLGLEVAIKAKIQAFHDTLGEDARYLTDEEDVSNHELFGDRLLSTLSSRDYLEGGDDEGPSELEFLSVIRKVRDENEDLFELVKKLPRKARSSRSGQGERRNSLMTFFRRGALKKFFITDGHTARDISFVEAAGMFECGPNTPRERIPGQFFEMLSLNTAGFDDSVAPAPVVGPRQAIGGNTGYVIARLKSVEMRTCRIFTEDDEAYRAGLLADLENKDVAQNTVKKMKQGIERIVEPLKVLAVLRSLLPADMLSSNNTDRRNPRAPREVVLSEFIVGEGK